MLKKYPWFLYLPLLTVLLAMVLCYASAPIGDFANNYFGSVIHSSGTDFESIYDAYQFNIGVSERGISDAYLSYSVLPPFNLLFFKPLNWFNPFTAKTLFNLFSVVAFAFSLWQLQVFMKLKPTMPFLALLFVAPLAANIYQGQLYLLLCSILIGGYILVERDHVKTGILFWAIAAALKIFPAVLILMFLQKKQYRYAIWFVLCGGALIAASTLIIPLAWWMNYAELILPKILANEFNNPFSTSFQSASVLFRKLFVADAEFNPDPLWNSTSVYLALDLGFKLLCGLIFWEISKASSSTFFRFALWLFFAVAISGYSTTYSLILLLPLAISLMKSAWRDKFLAALLLLAVNLPAHWFSELMIPFQLPRLMLFVALIVAFVVFYKVRLSKRLLVIVALIAVIRAGLYEPPLEGQMLHSGINRSMLFGLEVKNQKMYLNTLNARGEMRLEYDVEINSVDSIKASVKDGEIWIEDKQLTQSGSQKKNPIVLNENELYYLSDLHRGPGFFALRKIDLDD